MTFCFAELERVLLGALGGCGLYARGFFVRGQPIASRTPFVKPEMSHVLKTRVNEG